MKYQTVPLRADHKMSAFFCGLKSVDDFLHKRALQAMKARSCVVFVKENTKDEIEGFYTLSSDSIPREQIPKEYQERLPRYKSLGVTLIGQLGVQKVLQGNGLGTNLLMDAILRSYLTARESVGSVAVVIDPATERAKETYKKFGFTELPDNPHRLFIPMDTIEMLVEKIPAIDKAT